MRGGKKKGERQREKEDCVDWRRRRREARRDSSTFLQSRSPVSSSSSFPFFSFFVTLEKFPLFENSRLYPTTVLPPPPLRTIILLLLPPPLLTFRLLPLRGTSEAFLDSEYSLAGHFWANLKVKETNSGKKRSLIKMGGLFLFLFRLSHLSSRGGRDGDSHGLLARGEEETTTSSSSPPSQ